MEKIVKGRLSRSERGVDIQYQCIKCKKEITAAYYELGSGRASRDSPFIGLSSCTDCGGWIKLCFVNGFPTQEEIDTGAEIEIIVNEPIPSP